ncbi:MAG TPA: 23S rRNA (guanosine(2251)-2'-O)-methyltransferase RlmB, partial [Sphingomicrobium sp.]|nr:23S rRNA (guanosine(2251)-2'-O)-methyltransferase RlmB [Sphingomicrobium sp.]
MSRRKKSHQSHGTSNRPRFWGKHAVAAALDNPDRKVLRAWATREAAGLMQFPKDVQVTLAEAP